MPLFSQWRVYSLAERDARRDEFRAARGSSACRISFENWRTRLSFPTLGEKPQRFVLGKLSNEPISTTRPRTI